MYSVVVKFCSALCIATRIKIRSVGLVLYTVMGYIFRFSYSPLLNSLQLVSPKKTTYRVFLATFSCCKHDNASENVLKRVRNIGISSEIGLVVCRGVWKGSKELVDLYHVLKLRIRESDWLKPVFYLTIRL